MMGQGFALQYSLRVVLCVVGGAITQKVRIRVLSLSTEQADASAATSASKAAAAEPYWRCLIAYPSTEPNV